MSELNLTFHLCNTAVSAARALLLSAIVLIVCTGRFWAKNPNFYWRKQKFGTHPGTHLTEKPPRHLVHIVFWSAWDEMGQK